MISFFVPGTPVAKGSMIALKLGAGRIAVVDDFRGDRGKRLKRWMTAVAAAGAEAYQGQPLTGAVHVELWFCLTRPKSNKKTLPSGRPDIDKLARAVLDAIQAGAKWGGTLLKDDAQVVDLKVLKVWGGTPGVRVEVDALESEQEAMEL